MFGLGDMGSALARALDEPGSTGVASWTEAVGWPRVTRTVMVTRT